MAPLSLNRIWRLCATALSFAVFGIAGVLLPRVAAPAIFLASRDRLRRQRYARWLIHKVFLVYLHFLRGLGVLTWTAHDLERLRNPSTLVLANHPTLLDVVFLVAHIPQANCLVKGRLMNHAAMRGFIRMTGYIANSDGPELVAQAAESIQNGATLVVFPEGTRTHPGEPVHLKRGAANIALTAGAKILPVVIVCEPIVLSKLHRWYYVPERPVHFELRAQPALTLNAYLDFPRTVAARRLTRELEKFFNSELDTKNVNPSLGQVDAD